MVGFWAFLELLTGGILLWLGGEAVIRGSASLALRRNVSQLVVGVTIIGFGTSAPELFVSLIAALQGNQDIALGNVLGSNITNIGLVLGVSALIRVLTIHTSSIRLEIPFLIVTGLITWFLCGDKTLARKEAIILFLLLAAFLLYYLMNVKKREPEFLQVTESEELTVLKSTLAEFIYIFLGFLGLIGGAKLFVLGATGAARLLGVSEFFIGLSIVALGTSLPELATSIIAVLKNKIDLAIGNLIGSNVFNLLLILGCVAAIKPISVPMAALKFDFPVLAGLALLLLPLSLTQKKISRWEGGLLLAVYLSYISLIAIRG